MIELENARLREDDTLLYALAKMNKAGCRFLYVIDEEEKLVGVVTDGDFRRELLSKRDMNSRVSQFMNRNFTALHYRERRKALSIIAQGRFQEIPIVDDNGRVVDLVTLVNLHRSSAKTPSLPVVIMAGGKGVRLNPLTQIIPKPLVPVGDKTTIELIIDQFRTQGFREFYIIVNHMKELIKSYFYENDLTAGITFIDEEEFLGTAGGLRLLPDTLGDNFVLTNCDILVETDMVEFAQQHEERDATLSILTINQTMEVPYGVLELDESSSVVGMQEKPSFDYAIMSGVYMINRRAIEHIPPGQDFGMDKLIHALLESGDNVYGHVATGEMLDMGQFKGYRTMLKHFGLLT